jgi:hypothetical protein
MGTVTELSEYRTLPKKYERRARRRRRNPSMFELYPLPFFDAKSPCSSWNIKPTGNYEADCQTGQQYASEFLDTWDGTHGWTMLLPSIVADMIRAGPTGTFANGEPKINGIVIGFVGVLSRIIERTIALAKETPA